MAHVLYHIIFRYVDIFACVRHIDQLGPNWPRAEEAAYFKIVIISTNASTRLPLVVAFGTILPYNIWETRCCSYLAARIIRAMTLTFNAVTHRVRPITCDM